MKKEEAIAFSNKLTKLISDINGYEMGIEQLTNPSLQVLLAVNNEKYPLNAIIDEDVVIKGLNAMIFETRNRLAKKSKELETIELPRQ